MGPANYPRNESLEAAVTAEPESNAPRLVYADWLEEHGDALRAKHIRARCGLDDCVPGDDYVARWEQRLESAEALERRPPPELPRPFEVSTGHSDITNWWSDDPDGMERGFPSLATTSRPALGNDPGAWRAPLRKLLETTPVRAVDGVPPSLYDLPEARALTRLSASWADAIASPLATNLTRLQVSGGLNEVDGDSLHAAPFDRLRRLDVYHLDAPPERIARLASSPWFRRLQRLLIGLVRDDEGEGGLHLADMPHLHTLCLWGIGRHDVLGGREFPALRRLLIHYSNLDGEHGRALARVRAPVLMELWLRNSSVKKGDVSALAATALFDRLRALTFDSTALNAEGLKAIAASPSGPGLQALRIRFGAFQSLSKSALTRDGAFPELTTLELQQPHPNRVKEKDTAAFLARLATPKLRHLTLELCDFDDCCAEALAANPALRGLKRLVIWWGALGPSGATKLFHSANLRQLLCLSIVKCPIAEAASALADEEVLPDLVHCDFTDCDIPARVGNKLKRRRAVRVYPL
jgi:uncharacterized protein (TIGR02996 family)